MSRHDHLSSASWSLAKELSKNHLVYYVDNPLTIKDYILKGKRPFIKKRLNSKLSGAIYESLRTNLKIIYTWPTIPINWLKYGSLYRYFLKLNDTILYRAVIKVLKNDNVREFILFNSFNPFYGDTLQLKANPTLTIYQCRDNLKAAAYVYKHGPVLEKEKAQKADFVFATSVKLVELLRPYSKAIYYLPNAVDFEMFNLAATQNHKKPTDFQGNDRKIIGYIGQIDDRIDTEIVEFLLYDLKNLKVIFIGPAAISLDRLKNYSNFMHIDFTPYESLPAYLSFFDLAIIPFVKNEFTKYIYPLKINEYLSAGKPVVSTTFSDDIHDFKGIISLADDKETFRSSVLENLSTDSEEKRAKRIDFARKNSWTQRCNTLLELIEKHLPSE